MGGREGGLGSGVSVDVGVGRGGAVSGETGDNVVLRGMWFLSGRLIGFGTGDFGESNVEGNNKWRSRRKNRVMQSAVSRTWRFNEA